MCASVYVCVRACVCMSVYACVCACLSVRECHSTVRQWAQAQESVRTGREVERAGWEVDREMARRKEKRWAPFHNGCTHQPISPGLLQERLRWMAPPGGLEKSLQSHMGLLSKCKHTD